jgi:hypothetical protein
MDENLPQIPATSRWTLIRDAAVFQVKLVVDGLRDVVLVPMSLIAAIISLVSGDGGKPGPQFYQLLKVGKRSERWIDLFAAHAHAPDDSVDHEQLEDLSIDDLVHRMESFVVDEYKRGGVTAQAKDRIDQALNAIQRRRRREL